MIGLLGGVQIMDTPNNIGLLGGVVLMDEEGNPYSAVLVPDIPENGTYALQAVDGELAWVEVV